MGGDQEDEQGLLLKNVLDDAQENDELEDVQEVELKDVVELSPSIPVDCDHISDDANCLSPSHSYLQQQNNLKQKLHLDSDFLIMLHYAG